jgi:predicted nucleotidyltransferase component of viral defense system
MADWSITLDEIRVISGREKFSMPIIEKDYLVTYLLFLLKDITRIYFKGGTAINKIFLNHARLSEDLDFTLSRDLKEAEIEIREKLTGTIFNKISQGKSTEGFTRLIVHYKMFHEDGDIFIDLNRKATLILKPEKYKINQFYSGIIPEFEINCLNKEEMFAEKLRATIQRYKPRDYLDLYNLIKSGNSIDLELTKNKLESTGEKFDIKLIFKNSNKVFRLWKKDLAVITKEEISFNQVISFLADYFHLKEIKDSEKKKKNI